MIAAACKKQVDLALILDASGSVGKKDYGKAKKFLQNLVGQISVSANEVRVGVIVYSNRAGTFIKLNKYFKVADLKRAIARLPYLGRATNTPAAIYHAIRLLTWKNYGGRSNNVPNVGILFTGMLIA